MNQTDALNPNEPGRSRKKVFCLTCGETGVFNAAGPNKVPAWLCKNYPSCDSYVGVHPGTENALGTMANSALRAQRVKAHGWIDRIWRGKNKPTRKEVYQLIAKTISVRHFHVAQCSIEALARLSARRAHIEIAFGRPDAAPVNKDTSASQPAPESAPGTTQTADVNTRGTVQTIVVASSNHPMS